MAELRDEYGNRVELTDELGNPVQLRDEHGNPVHIKGVATPAGEVTTTSISGTPVGGGGGRRDVEGGPLDTTPHTLGEVLKSTNDDPTTEMADVSVAGAGAGAGAAAAAGAGTAGLISTTIIEKKETGYTPEIQRSPSTSSSSSSEDDGQGGRRKKKGITQKIKEKLSGKHNKDPTGHVPGTTGTTGGSDYPSTLGGGGGGIQHTEHEKKSMFEKIKDKLPGHGHGHHNH
ncbi:Probable dehydrin LEA [Linum perenne]